MSFNRVGIRFAAEAVAILVTAVIAGPLLHLVWWQVGVAVFAVLGVGIFIESSLAAPDPAPKPAAAPAVQRPSVIEEPTHVRVLQERPLSAPVPEVVPEPEPEPEPELEPEPEPAPAPVAMATRVVGPPFNVWELERALGDSGNPDEEKTFMLQYLRDYAASDGTLPREFDDLVRESFASLL